jgi:hypothetical protein
MQVEITPASRIKTLMEPLIKLLQVEIELLRTIEKLAEALNTSTESFDYLYKPVDNWNPVMDMIGLPKNGEMIPGFPNPFSRDSFEDVFFDLHYGVLGDSYEVSKDHLEFMKEWIKANIKSLEIESAIHD